jgi:hypothetical protein
MAGYGLGDNWTKVEEYVGVYSKAILGLAVLAVVAFIVVRVLKSRGKGPRGAHAAPRNNERPESEPTPAPVPVPAPMGYDGTPVYDGTPGYGAPQNTSPQGRHHAPQDQYGQPQPGYGAAPQPPLPQGGFGEPPRSAPPRGGPPQDGPGGQDGNRDRFW